MEDSRIYALLISVIPTEKLKILSAKIQVLTNEINTELHERSGMIQSIHIYQSADKEITINGNNISEFINEILFESKRYGNAVAKVIDINTITIEYTNVVNAQNALQHQNELLYAIQKIFIN